MMQATVVLGLVQARVTSSRKIKATWLESCLNFFQPVGVKVMLKKRVIAAVAAALMAGGASAVEVSRDGVGDFLIAPAYFIGGGLTTELKLVNTSSTQSTVAKVVFRDKVTSAEILDFLVYLSPSDVWTGKVSCVEAAPNGQCVKSEVRSTDDSVQQYGSNDFASATAPMVITNPAEGRVVLPNEGYVDIEMGPAYTIAPNQSPKAGVSKASIFAAHNARVNLGAVALNETPNILTGVVAVTHPSLGTTDLPMLALEDYNTAIVPQVGIASGFDVTVGQNTTLADVEEAIWKDNHIVPFDKTNGAINLVSFTFPTKLTYNNTTDGQYPFASQVCYTPDMYDMEEQTIKGGVVNVSPLPSNPPACVNEFDFKLFGQPGLSTGTFNTGWARIKYRDPRIAVAQVGTPADSSNVGRSGVPGIVTYMSIDTAAKKFTWSYAASRR